MRKFLDFVVRDDHPVLTPPSENESAYEQLRVDDYTNGHEEDAPVVPNTTDKVNDLNYESVRVISGVGEAGISEESSKPTDPSGFKSDTSDSRESGTGCIVWVPSASSDQSDGTSDSATCDEVHENTRCKTTPAESVFLTGRSQLRKQFAESSNPSGSRGSRPRVRELLSRSDDRLRNAARILSSFASDGVEEAWKDPDARLHETRVVVSALREIAETMVWADQHEPSLWDTFMECSFMPLLMRCLRATVAPHVSAEENSAQNSVRTAADDADIRSSSESSQQSDSNERLRKETPSADQGGTGLPDSAPKQKDTDSTLSQIFTSTSSSPNRGKDVESSRRPPASEEVREVRDNDAMDQVSRQVALEIQSQVLQTLSIMIQSLFRQHSLLCLFSSNHINEILSFGFRFEDDEIVGYFMSAVKTIALKLDQALLQLFFDPSRGTFPLYSTVIRFFDHREQMVRIAVRNVTLTIYALGDPEVVTFAARDEFMYLYKTVDLLAKLCGSVARSLELILDDGREVRRTRSRTGIFLQKVRTSEVTIKLEEIENLFAYLGDVSSLSMDTLRPLVSRLLSMKLFSPFFRPMASRASPRAVQLQKRWRLTNKASDIFTPALAPFDAAARCLLLAYVLETCRSSCLGQELTRELSRCTSEFEERSVLHALKAMASDITGAERVSFVALCSIEAFILCAATTRDMMRSLKYDFSGHNPAESRATQRFNRPFAVGEYHVEEEHRKNQEEPLLMTLSDFGAPLTPSNSLPSTPTKYVPLSPSDSATPPKGLARVMSATSLSTDGLTFLESSESDEVLSMFQLGETSLRETISSLILVVRRREIRTLRTVHAICRIVSAVGCKTNNFRLCAEVSKVILDKIAEVMLSFLGDKRTTIVSIEQMFDNFRSVAEEGLSEYCTILSLDKILSPDAVPEIAADFPKGAGKRRRARKDETIPPTETEDAVVLFAMLHAYESALDKQHEVDKLPSVKMSRISENRLSSEVREILLKCKLEESYLEKRETLQDVARTVQKRGDID